MTLRAAMMVGGGEMGKVIRDRDWSTTPLGPIERWPASLQTTINLALASTFPISIIWGPDHTQIYNDGYRPICGAKHPRSMGQDFRACWASAFPIIGAGYDRAWAGDAAFLENQRMFIDRTGSLEETFFTFSFSPIRDETGQVSGLFHPVIETTAEMIGARRIHVLRDLAARGAKATTVDEACRVVAETLAAHDLDLPFVLVYLERDDGELELAATTGLRAGDPAAPHLAAEPGWPVAAALRSDQPIIVDDLASRFGVLACGPYPEPPTAAFVAPFRLAVSDRTTGAVIAGISARIPFDDRYRDFCGLLADAIAVVITNARAYAEERKRAEALAELDRAKTAFFSNVSHEFRTPLTLLLGPLEDARASEYGLAGDDLEVAYRGALRLLKLVNALLDFSRLEAGRVAAKYEPVDLAALTTELAGVFRAAVERAGLKLIVRCEPGDPVHVDREMWEKIVLNLVSNAFKFTFEGRIEVTLRRTDGHVELIVRDTGTGVPRAEVPRLFERFHRIEGAKARTHEGSGIGLALVQELVRLHGGQIRVESVYGVGTTFTVSIPTGTAHLPRDRIVATELHPATTARAAQFVEEAVRWLPDAATPSPLELPASSVVAPGERARVLVADDNADMRAYLRRILGAWWEVDVASDGDAALALARQSRPDLVLTDVMMPGLTGFGLLAALRDDPRTRSIPIIMLSARAGAEARIEGLEAGADDYLVKPFSARELVARVESQLALSAGHRERARLLEREHAARHEAELERRHLHALFMQAPTPIAILRGASHVVELVNPEACRLLGRGHDDVVDRPVLESVPEPLRARIHDLLDQTFRAGETRTAKDVEVELDRSGDGVLETAYMNLVCTPLRGAQDEVAGVLVIGLEVTDEVLARNRNAALREQAEAASRAKDEMLALLGHELRNPLAPIVMSLDLLRERGVRFEEQAILERQVGHLTHLVDDLLDISRITRGTLELRRQPIEIASAVARAVELAGPLLEQRGQRVDVRVAPSGLGVDIDLARMAQVLANLLANAAKFSDPGETIVVAAERDAGRVRVRVEDRGIGIAPELIVNIFDRFVQQAQPLDRAQGGLGFGLAIVKHLVELHGGSVRAESEGLGMGSAFTIDLPAVEPGRMVAGAVAHARATARAVTTANGARILVVDDNVDAAETLRVALALRGHQVAVAHDGTSALETAEEFVPEIALLDIGLPVMDGYELARRLRALPNGAREIHLVAITGYGQDADRRRSAEAGFERHLVKPVELAQLDQVVKELRTGHA